MISKRAAQILIDLKGAPYKTPEQLGQNLSLSYDSVNGHIKELEKAGLAIPYHLDEEGVLIEGRKHRSQVYIGLIPDGDRIDEAIVEAGVEESASTTRTISLEDTPPSPSEMRYRQITQKLCKDVYDEIIDGMYFTELQMAIDQAIRLDRWRPLGLGPLRELSGIVRQLESAGWVEISPTMQLLKHAADETKLREVVAEYRDHWLRVCEHDRKKSSTELAEGWGRRTQ